VWKGKTEGKKRVLHRVKLWAGGTPLYFHVGGKWWQREWPPV
jgi:hypothetical protein